MIPTLFRSVQILGTGHALPVRQVSSEELDQTLSLKRGTLRKKTGVAQRFFAAEGQTAAQLGAQAAHLALEAAGLTLGGIDCLVAASGTMDQGMPCNAALIHHELGLQASTIPAFDINASCLGFMTAVDHLSWALMGGRYQRVLIVSADIGSRGLDWSKLEASGIFGDGAAAVVLAVGAGESRILASSMQTLSRGVSYCRIEGGGTRFHPSRSGEEYRRQALFHMDGKAVFRLVAEYIEGFVDDLLLQADLRMSDIDWVVPHQASQLAMHHLAKRLRIPSAKMVDIFADHGNQIAASLPTALDIAVRDGRIQRGHRLLLLGTGAGVSISGLVMVY